MTGGTIDTEPAVPYTDAAARRTYAELFRLLDEDPSSVGFFQAVRLLERLLPERAPVGGFGDPADEAVRFRVPPTLAFPASEVQALELRDDEPARMAVNFMGLTGPQGVLPHAYTLHTADRTRARDTALRDFLDLFHHRVVSLFYRAWSKYHPHVRHERDREDPLADHVADLIGFGTAGMRGRLSVRDESLLFYSGLLAPHRPSAVALEQLVADYFGIPITVEQFVGGWFPLERADQCELGDEGPTANPLGLGAVVGDEVWDQQASVRVRLGPLTRAQYDDFLPGAPGLQRLRELVRVFARDEIRFEAQLVLARDEVPPCRIGADDPDDVLPLGWATWLVTRAPARDPDDTVLAL